MKLRCKEYNRSSPGKRNARARDEVKPTSPNIPANALNDLASSP